MYYEEGKVSFSEEDGEPFWDQYTLADKYYEKLQDVCKAVNVYGINNNCTHRLSDFLV